MLTIRSALADTVLMRNGDILTGTIVNQSSASIVLQNEEESRVIQKTQIARVIYDHPLPDSETEEALEEKRRIEQERIEAELRNRQKLADQKLKEAVDRIAENAKKKPESTRAGDDADTIRSDNTDAAETKSEEETVPSIAEQHHDDGDSESNEPIPDIPTGKSGQDWNAVWKSALIPGAGQYLRGERWKGLGFALAAAGGAFAIYDNNRHYRQARADLASEGNPFAPSYLLLDNLGLNTLPSVAQLSDPLYLYEYGEPYRSRQHSANLHYGYMQNAGWFLGVVYLWNLFDASQPAHADMRTQSFRTGPRITPIFATFRSHARWSRKPEGRSDSFHGLTLQWTF